MFLKCNKKVIAFLGLMVLAMSTIIGVVMLHHNSALAQSQCACVQSEAQPQNGQKARSSGNFSTQGCTTTLIWSLPDSVSVDIARDVSGGKDPTYFRVQNGNKTSNPNQRSLYIANPHGAQEGFQVCALNRPNNSVSD